MADKFDLGETIICSITVTDSNGDAQDPETSMNIQVERLHPLPSSMLSATAMSKDDTGEYHYDINTSSYIKGTYQVIYIATDGSRISKTKDQFELS